MTTMSEGQGSGLEVRGLWKTYGDDVIALAGVDLSVGPGLYGLLGPNGAGKSTLMRTLATLQEPDAGTISLDGIDARRDPDHLRRRLGYLPQSIGAYPGVSARSLLDRFAWLKGRTDRDQRAREVDFLLDRVNLTRDRDRAVSAYSGGMLRRFGIAIALLGSPRLLVVDEPTAGLDPAERTRFHRILADVGEGAVVLLSTHIVEDVETLCPRLAVLAAGRIVAEGTIDDLLRPLSGRLWSRTLARGEVLPDQALRSQPTARGTRVIVEGAAAPGAGYQAHVPSLEDLYHHALRRAGIEEAA